MRSDHDSLYQGEPNSERSDSFLRAFLASETVGGAIALVAALIAVIWANTDLSGYHQLQHLKLGPLSLEHWAADGGLTLFFFVAGLELKREFTLGSLRNPRLAAIPVVAACCGVAVPALVFMVVNLNTGNLRGWAIPAPTDIAFALAVLAVIASRVPSGLRVFLLTLAVVDDLIVIAIIAVAYSTDLKAGWLMGAVALIVGYAVLAALRPPLAVWLLVPLALGAWWCTLHSGIHATVAGVILALLTPVSERLEHLLAPWSAGLAVPIFALTSAGVALTGSLGGPVMWGVIAGLVLGKPLGIVVGTVITSRITKVPWDGDGTSGLRSLIGLGCVAGIGFTVALLVSDLAYLDARVATAKAGVLIASTASALLGVLILSVGRRSRQAG